MKGIKITVLLHLILLSSCSLAPDYHRPKINIPTEYKESGQWLHANPLQADLDHGPWWRLYNDHDLNTLENQVCKANQNLKAAIARYEEARAAAAVAHAAYFPTGIGIANASRQQTSGSIANKSNIPLYNDMLLGLDFSYEVDVWGRVKNSVAAAVHRAHASAADVAAINLGLQAELASDYFSLRAADASQRIYDQTVLAYQKALYLTRNRYKGGAAPVADVDQAEAQLENARTLSADNRLKRTQLEHAIATLIGQPPGHFSLHPAIGNIKLVTLAPYLPSTLLERRPDIAAAELRVQAANADIGVARAAYFPDFNLAAGIGLESAVLSNLLKTPSLIWSIGPSTSLGSLDIARAPLANYTIFDGGAISAITREAWATYHENVALYRQTVLTALQEVEDSLIALRQLNRENKTQTVATAAANRALTQAIYRYEGGITTYLDVVVVQNIALQAQLASVNIHTRRQIASIQLIKALGGGWPEYKSGSTFRK